MTNYIHTVCKMGQGKDCCRYLAAGKDGIVCLKLHEEAKRIIDARVARGSFVAQGDNCDGKDEKVILTEIES